MKFKMNKTEKSWVLYDFANSSYATIMVAAIFPIYFSQVCESVGQTGDYWWGIASSVSALIVAVLAPIIGALADIKGYKKKLLVFFIALGLGFSIIGALSTHWQMLLTAYLVSNIGFLGGNVVYDSFLTDITSRDRMATISSWAYGLGYIGGSTIPFLMGVALVVFGENFGVDGTMAVKYSLWIMIFWWGLFSIPIIKNVQQIHGIDKPQDFRLLDTWGWVIETAKKIVKNKAMLVLMASYFFYIDGVNTVISMSTSYGTTLGLDSTGMILALVVTQLVAFPCAIYFGQLSQKFGSLKMIKVAIWIYLLICSLAFVMGYGLEESVLTLQQSTTLFWILAILVGMVQGGIQAISRSTFAKLVPPENSGEYFGFFDIFGKFAAIMGPALYASILAITGKSYFAIFSLIVLFILALVILKFGKNELSNL